MPCSCSTPASCRSTSTSTGVAPAARVIAGSVIAGRARRPVAKVRSSASCQSPARPSEMVGVDTVNLSLAGRIEAVREQVGEAARAAGREPDDVTVVAVSKTMTRTAVDEAFALGLRCFGENRVQEARDKFVEPLPPGGSIHLIGQLQSNKARLACRLFDCIESVDRVSLVETLAQEARKADRRMPVLIQVNVAGETQKAGCAPDEAMALAQQVVGTDTLRLDGLMTIAPLVADMEETRPIFRALRELRDRLQDRLAGYDLPVLSMGMSNDFAVAITEGATHVRI